MCPLTDLAPDPANARAIAPENAAALRVSMRRFGDLSGIVHNAEAGVLVAGHQRLDQLRAEGVEGWTTLRACGDSLTYPDGDGEEGEGEIVHPETGRRFRVRVVRWGPESHRVANIVANSPELIGYFTPLVLPQLAALTALPDLPPVRFEELRASLEHLDVDVSPPTVAAGATGATVRTFVFVLDQDGGQIVDRAFAALRKEHHGADDNTLFLALARRTEDACA